MKSSSSLAVAFALAHLYLLYLTGPLISPQHQLIFHLPGPATALFAAALLDLAALTTLFACLLRGTERHPRLQLLLWATLLLPLPAVLLGTAASFTGRPANLWLMSTCILLAAALFSYTLARPSALLQLFHRVQPALATLLVLISFSGLLVTGQLLWNAWQTRNLNPGFLPRVDPGTAQEAAPNSAAPRRVVWVILDELSYRQIFSDRLPGLALPNFDRLAGSSTVLTDTVAAANYTRIAVPSLLTGLPLSATAPTASGRQIRLFARGARNWQFLRPADTVFSDVGRLGLPTGIAGWYEPYCRLFSGVVNRCFWTYHDDLPLGVHARASVVSNALGPLRALGNGLQILGDSLLRAQPADDEAGRLDVARHAADYRALYAAADTLLEQQHTGLLLLHMPIPHPWGFYDRRTRSFPNHRTSYLDNLVLADAYLGHLREVMETDGSWNGTTLVLMGDHGWRTREVWRPSGYWTAEEEKASHGGTLADRPAAFIKLAGQQTPARITVPFEAFRTRGLIDAVFAGRLPTAESLQHWIAHPEPVVPAP